MSAAIRFRGRVTWLFAACALVAVSVLLVRPLCEFLELRGASPHAGSTLAIQPTDPASHERDALPCCASVDDASLVVPTLSVMAETKSLSTIKPADLPLAWRLAPRSFQAAIAPDLPPISRPYHSRTARILV